MPEPRTVAYILPTEPFNKANNGFRPVFIKEGESGYHPNGSTPEGGDVEPWYWGPSREAAEATADKYNEKRGISKDDAAQIVVRSMFG